MSAPASGLQARHSAKTSLNTKRDPVGGLASAEEPHLVDHECVGLPRTAAERRRGTTKAGIASPHNKTRQLAHPHTLADLSHQGTVAPIARHARHPTDLRLLITPDLLQRNRPGFARCEWLREYLCQHQLTLAEILREITRLYRDGGHSPRVLFCGSVNRHDDGGMEVRTTRGERTGHQKTARCGCLSHVAR